MPTSDSAPRQLSLALRSASVSMVRLESDSAPSGSAPSPAPEPLLTPRVAPPPSYYADNVKIMLRTIIDQYADLLDEAERAGVDTLLSLPEDGLRLFARLISRKGPCFRVDALDYAEIVDQRGAIEALVRESLLGWCQPVVPGQLLAKLRRDEIEALFPHEARNVRKAELIDRLVARFAPVTVFEKVRRVTPWLSLTTDALFERLRILFFGDPYQDMSAFVMRDLGLVRYEEVDVGRANRLFADRATFDNYLELLALNREAGRLGDGLRAPVCEAAATSLIEKLWNVEDHRTLERRRSRTLNRLGRALERRGLFDAALTAYGRSTLPPARERRTRILARLRDEAAVQGLIDTLRERPLSAEEHDFACRFGRRRSRRDVPIDDFVLEEPLEDQSIEQFALAQLTADGGVGWHMENCLPMALFTIAYWDWIFAPIEGAFVNAFQSGPLDLLWPDFFDKRSHLPRPSVEHLKATLLARTHDKEGTANPLFRWQRWVEAAPTIVDAVPAADLDRLIRVVADDLPRARTGFPDLTVVYPSGAFEFVEVKGPGDQLQNNQLLWIAALQAHQLPVRVVRYSVRERSG